MRAVAITVTLLALTTPAAAEQPRIFVEGGAVLRSYDNPVTKSAEPDQGLMWSWRVGATFGPLYVAAEGEVGGALKTDGLAARDLAIESFGYSPDHGHLAVVHGVVVAGARSRHGRTELGVELAAGGRRVEYAFERTPDDPENADVLADSMKVLEVRARAGYWLSPNVTAVVALGTSLVDDGWMGGLHIAVLTDRR